jgi:hypothetical protein
MQLLGSIHTLLNPHTREPIIFLHPRGALSSSHLSRLGAHERFKMEINYLIGMLVFGEDLQDWML